MHIPPSYPRRPAAGTRLFPWSHTREDWQHRLAHSRDEDEDDDDNRWTTVQIITPIVVGLGSLAICFALFIWYRARHKPTNPHPARPQSALDRARNLPVFNSFNSLPQVREASPDPGWTIDVDGATEPYLHASAGHARSSSATPLVGTYGSATNLSRRTEAWSDSGSGPWRRVRLWLMRAKWAMPWAERPVKIRSTQPNKRWRIDGTPGPSRRTTAQTSVTPEGANDRDNVAQATRDRLAEEEELLPDAGQPTMLFNPHAQTTSPRVAQYPASPPARQDSEGSRHIHMSPEPARGLLPDDTSVVLISRYPGEDFTIASSSNDEHRGIVVVPPSRQGTPFTMRRDDQSLGDTHSHEPSSGLRREVFTSEEPSPPPVAAASPSPHSSPPLAQQRLQASGSGSSPDLETPDSTAPSFARYYDAQELHVSDATHSPLTAAAASSENTHGLQRDVPWGDASGPSVAVSPPSHHANASSHDVTASYDVGDFAPDERLPTYREASLSRRPLPTPSPHFGNPMLSTSPPNYANASTHANAPNYGNAQYLTPPRGLQHQQFRSLGDMREEDADFQAGRLPPRERWVSADDLLAQPEDPHGEWGR
ncbi:hypothetical protein HDZ31DRAFT_72750 [Schizophyllum fasciatum]